MYFLAMDVNLAAIDRVRAEDRAHGLGTTGADQARKAQDLAAVCFEVYAEEDTALLQVFDLQERVFALLAIFLRELVIQATANHRSDQRIIVPILGITGLDELAVADNRNAVAQFKQLFELMRYEHDADAAALQFTAGLEQLLNFLLAEGGGRLVHDDHLGIDQNRLGDLDHLLDAHTEGAGRLARVNILAQGSHDFLGLLVHGGVVEQAALLDPLVDENVVGNAHQRLNIQLLVYAGDTSGRGLIRVLELLELSFDVDLAFIRLMYAGQHLDQRGLTRAVLTDQAKDLTRLDVQVHVVQCDDAREQLHRIF